MNKPEIIEKISKIRDDLQAIAPGYSIVKRADLDQILLERRTLQTDLDSLIKVVETIAPLIPKPKEGKSGPNITDLIGMAPKIKNLISSIQEDPEQANHFEKVGDILARYSAPGSDQLALKADDGNDDPVS